jgi:hypothetical protein
MSNDRRQELRDIAKSMLPDTVISLALVEHQLDLMAYLLKSLLNRVDETTLTQQEKDMIAYLDQVLAKSSVDFNDIANPFQAYKLPKMVEVKNHTRVVQGKYLKKQMEEGLL